MVAPLRLQVKYLNEGRFNYVGCSAYDMVSHYFDAGRMYCTWAVKLHISLKMSIEGMLC